MFMLNYGSLMRGWVSYYLKKKGGVSVRFLCFEWAFVFNLMGFVIVLEIPWGSLNCVLSVCVCVFYEICSIGSIVMDFRTLGLIYIVALQRRRLYLTKIYVFFIFTVSTAHNQDGDFSRFPLLLVLTANLLIKDSYWVNMSLKPFLHNIWYFQHLGSTVGYDCGVI